MKVLLLNGRHINVQLFKDFCERWSGLQIPVAGIEQCYRDLIPQWVGAKLLLQCDDYFKLSPRGEDLYASLNHMPEEPEAVPSSGTPCTACDELGMQSLFTSVHACDVCGGSKILPSHPSNYVVGIAFSDEARPVDVVNPWIPSSTAKQAARGVRSPTAAERQVRLCMLLATAFIPLLATAFIPEASSLEIEDKAIKLMGLNLPEDFLTGKADFDAVEVARKFSFDDEKMDLRFRFGKHARKRLTKVPLDYLQWMLTAGFNDTIHLIVQQEVVHRKQNTARHGKGSSPGCRIT